MALVYMPVLAFLFVRFALTSVIMLPTTWRSVARQPLATLKAGIPLGIILFLYLHLRNSRDCQHQCQQRGLF